MTIVVLHAYSRTNSGDGLLVDLTAQRLSRLFPEERILVVAQDVDSFPEYDVRAWSAAFSVTSASSRLSTVQASVTGLEKGLLAILKSARLIVGVGGGYLRAGSLVEFLKSYFAHYAQLKVASKMEPPVIYLPQSIGPYPPALRAMVLRRLGALDRVFVRDDRSMAMLGRLGNSVRMPDLAVLELAESDFVPLTGAFGHPVAIARDLERPGRYYETMDELAATERFDWAIQAAGRGNDDTPISQRLSRGNAMFVDKVLDGREPRVVVSTRLHGALQALLKGYPAVHLGYERKSWGAFEDLGLDEYVMNCRRVSASEVLAAVERIEADPSGYWSRVREARDRILESSRRLDASLSGLVEKSTG